jgi:hypothetical protein
MFARSLSFLSAAWRPSKLKAGPRVESRPPGPTRAVGTGIGWRAALGRRADIETLATARLEFAEALFDIHSDAAASLLDRIAIARSLHELWYLREEIFSIVSCRSDQAEAARRLAELDRHFGRRLHGPAPAPPT